jgi:hypothetical protein
MNIIKNTFLFVVGVVTIAFDEVTTSLDEAIKSVEEQREKLNERFVKTEL